MWICKGENAMSANAPSASRRSNASSRRANSPATPSVSTLKSRDTA